MDSRDIENKITAIIGPVINSIGIALDSLEFFRTGKKGLLRVYIDKEGGVTIGDCEKVSREVEAVLDVEDPIKVPYVLEVSSPGLDRPLKIPGDFKKYCGKKVRVVTLEPVDKQTFFTGVITDAGENEISLVLEKDKTIVIPYTIISKARLEVEA